MDLHPNSRMVRAKAVTSDTDSPFMRNAVTKLPICAWVALPDMMVRMASGRFILAQVLPVHELLDVSLS